MKQVGTVTDLMDNKIEFEGDIYFKTKQGFIIAATNGKPVLVVYDPEMKPHLLDANAPVYQDEG